MAFKAYQYFSFGRSSARKFAKTDIAWRKSNVYKVSCIALLASIPIYATAKTFIHSENFSEFAVTFVFAAFLFNLVSEQIIFRKITEKEIDEEIGVIREDNEKRFENFDKKYDKKIADFGKVIKWFTVFLILAAVFLIAVVILYGSK